MEPCLSSLLLSVFYHCVTYSGGLNPVTIAIRLMSRETLNSQVSQECYGPESSSMFDWECYEYRQIRSMNTVIMPPDSSPPTFK